MLNITVSLAQPDPTLAFAGSELAAHIGMLPLEASDYPVRIQLNEDAPDPSSDSFSYCFDADGGFLCGSNPRSVLLGVYDYLRRIGFVFLRPGEGGTFVPDLHERSQLYCQRVSHTAAFRHRGVCIEGANSLENVLDFIDWLPKNGYNAFFVQFKKPDIFFERWYNHDFNPLVPAQHLTREQLDDIESAVTEAMVLRGLCDHRVGHGWTAEALGYANTGWHTEDGAVSGADPELIALVNGKRELFGGIPTNTNLCYSNPESRRRLIQQVVDYAKSHRSVNYLHFWLADEYNNVCECPECAKTTLSDQYVEILNELDRKLTAEGLDTKIVFLLYQELLYAPIKSRLEHPERFCLMFAPISRTFEKPYPSDGFSASIAPYVRNKFKLPETVEENLSHYFNWQKIYHGDTFFYDYPLGRAHYGDFGYMKIAKVIYDDIHTLSRLGSHGYMSCQELRAMTPSGFPNYVMGLSLLDPQISYEQMKQTYFHAMFGENWAFVVEYLEQLSELSDTDYFNGHGKRKQPDKKVRFHHISQTALAFLMDLDEMRRPDPRTDENWEFLKFHGRYCILLSCALGALCEGDQATADAHFQEFCDFVRQNEPVWQSRLDVYRVIEVATKYTGFSKV